MKTDLFQSCDHCWVFQICWHIECSTFTASSFSIWNSSTAIPSPSLALFIVMLPMAHLPSQSRMSGSRWVITPSWLSGSWKSLLGPHHFCPLLSPFFMKYSLGISNCLEEIASLSHSIVFLYFFALITDDGFLISPCYSLEHFIQMGISFFFLFAFCFSSFHSYL